MRGTGGRTYGGWSPLLLLAVLGVLFAMHGLQTHESAHASGPVPSAGEPHAQHGQPVATGSPESRVDPAPTEEGGDGGGHSLAELCLAVLAAGLLLAALRGAVRRVVLLEVPRLSLLAMPRPARARDPDPPDLVRLSVCRC